MDRLLDKLEIQPDATRLNVASAPPGLHLLHAPPRHFHADDTVQPPDVKPPVGSSSGSPLPHFPHLQNLLRRSLAIFVQIWYIACMSNQHTASEHSEEQQHTKERIIAAASKVLAEKGYDATTLREISREAQAAPGLVHYYFGGKDALLVEALQAAGRQFHQRMERLIQQVPADQSLGVFLTQLSERVEQEPEVYRLRYESFSLGLHNPIIAPAVRERLAQRREEIGSVMATVMENLETTEGVKRSSLEPTVLAALLLALFDGLALQKIMDPSFDLDAAYHLLAQMLRGLLRS